MEPLYSVKTALTEEEFVRFSRFVAHSNKKNLTIIIVCGLLILAFAINDFVYRPFEAQKRRHYSTPCCVQEG